MKRAYLFNICAAIWLCTAHIDAQNAHEKVVTRSFPMTDAGQLIIENKYGDVRIAGWDKNEVEVKATVVVKGDDEELFDRIQPTFDSAEEFLKVVTEIEPVSDGYWRRLWRNLNPVEFDKSAVDVHYEIFIPASAQIKSENKYGDIVLEDCLGKFRGMVEHGDIRISGDVQYADININFGLFRTYNLKNGEVAVRNGDVDITSADRLTLSCVGTDIEIDSVDELRIQSSKDDIIFGSVGHASGEIRYSKVKLRELRSSMDLKFYQADMEVQSVTPNLNDISIDQASSDIVLDVNNISLRIKASLEAGLLRLPKTVEDLEVHTINEKKELREVQALYGRAPHIPLNIVGKKGYIVIR